MSDVTTRVQFTVLDKPFGKERPRFSRKTGRAFTSKPTEIAEQAVRLSWHAAGAVTLPDNVPLAMVVECFCERPKSHLRVGGSINATGLRMGETLSLAKPDIDNAVKLVMDALEGYAYPRDVTIAVLSARKSWGSPARTEVTVEVAS